MTDRLASYEQDETVAVHVAVALEGGSEPAGVGTVYAEPPPQQHRGAIPTFAYEPGASWRLRGMATSEATRGAGLGRVVLEECFEVVRDHGGRVLWCNARVGAQGFYEHLGLEIPEIGPHFVMWRPV